MFLLTIAFCMFQWTILAVLAEEIKKLVLPQKGAVPIWLALQTERVQAVCGCLAAVALLLRVPFATWLGWLCAALMTIVVFLKSGLLGQFGGQMMTYLIFVAQILIAINFAFALLKYQRWRAALAEFDGSDIRQE